jgi:hypothetical protein
MNMSNVRFEYFPQNRPTLAFLEPTLRSMSQAMDRYVEFVMSLHPEQDTPYMYCERATLSQFAGGVWLSDPDNLVLEEYVSDKQCDAGKYRGRGDIWFKAGGALCCGEAKQGWVSLARQRHTGWNDKLAVLRDECEAAYRNSEDDRAVGSVRYPLGMLFLPVAVTYESLSDFWLRVDTFHVEIRNDVRIMVDCGEYEVLWAHYRRLDLLDPNRFYSAGTERVAQPALETIVCLKR